MAGGHRQQPDGNRTDTGGPALTPLAPNPRAREGRTDPATSVSSATHDQSDPLEPAGRRCWCFCSAIFRFGATLVAAASDLIDPTIAVHHGRVVKRTGDGILIEFRSVVDAVRCAIEVQNGMAERNAGLPPERRIEFRVGIHLGDVVEESDGDLIG